MLIKSIADADFSALSLNKACSHYLYEKNKQPGFSYKNEDVFFLFRYAITGNPVGAPIGEIAEVIGKKETLARLDEAQDIFEKQNEKAKKRVKD